MIEWLTMPLQVPRYELLIDYLLILAGGVFLMVSAVRTTRGRKCPRR